MGPPGEEIYQLEQKWMQSCKLSHDLFCLCPDFRQHFLPGPGCFTPVGEDTGGEGDGLDEVMVNFDLGEPDGDADHGGDDAGEG